MDRAIYFDPFNGASGDMILGALIDLGLPLAHLNSELGKLPLEGYALKAENIVRQGLEGINFRVMIEDETSSGHGHGDAHSHGHVRGFSSIKKLLEKSGLNPRITEQGVDIFKRLAEAEAKVHGTSVEEVHFHEVGAVDSIVDVVGACIGFHYFGVERFFTAPLTLGGGSVTFSHGNWPVPTPATAELVAGFPVLLGGNSGELTTPTGAAIVTTLVEKGGTPSLFKVESSGFGAGDREVEGIPNMLRLLLGWSGPDCSPCLPAGTEKFRWPQEEVFLLEANLDDTDAETLGHILELAMEKGALDAYCTPLQMKKSRPGVQFSILCRREDREEMAGLMFRETTTLGVRWSAWNRWVLGREVKEVSTQFGPVRVKMISENGQVVRMSPEYEDLRSIAADRDLPLRTVRQRVLEDLLNYRHE